ncbi:glucose-1-phosphate thymidylyltransferase RfbA [Roseibium sp. HPY-6]|uniref:glucose-1-phosphate thymidylyltransferase RfbA n=1 Tax=Roseibium sp. HPY-6 TaxID=3229852 RepID=UPI00338F3C10
MTNEPGKDPIGLLLAGGTGSRLFPTTRSVNKHLLHVYDKPLIYYSLSLLMLIKVREVVFICRPEDEAAFRGLLGDGSQWGMTLNYVHQDEPHGIAEVFLLCAQQIGNRDSVLVLGDNLIHGSNLASVLQRVLEENVGASILGYPVKNPEAFGVVELSGDHEVLSLEEKPDHPRSNLAVPGFYCYDGRAVEFAKSLKPSKRNELEITDLNKLYLADGSLKAVDLGRGVAWLDGGTPEGLFEASQYVRTMQRRNGLMIASPEEMAWRNGWIDRSDLVALCENNKSNDYFNLLHEICVRPQSKTVLNPSD